MVFLQTDIAQAPFYDICEGRIYVMARKVVKNYIVQNCQKDFIILMAVWQVIDSL